VTVVARYAAAEFAEGSPEFWLLFICPHPLLSILHRGNEHRRGLPREEASRVLARYQRKVAVEAIVVLEFIRASRTQSVFASSAAQMAGDLHDVITDALACLDVPNPNAVVQQVSALVGDRLTVQHYSDVEVRRQ
jgi:hypothetical protein